MRSIPKIKGYIATKKNRIVFLYRRSNKVTYLVLLNYSRRKESIQVGSRFYGKIYPHRCDFSADGNYFLYFAMGSSQQQYKKQLYCWTGICIPPSITANLLFAHGDTWGGGGRFIDDQTIFISPGMYPDFDRGATYSFDNYQISFAGKREDSGWTYGKGWWLADTQIDPKLGEKYPIPKCWTKTRGSMTLIKNLNYDLYLKSKDGHTVGEYDLHNYEVENYQGDRSYVLSEGDSECLWADFDNYDRLIVAKKQFVYIYQNLKDVIQARPLRIIDLEQLVFSSSS